MLFKKTFLLMNIIFCLNLNALTNKEAQVWAKITTGFATFLYVGTKYIKNSDYYFDNADIVKLALSSCLFAATAYLVSNVTFSSYTPKGCLESAKEKIRFHTKLIDLVNSHNNDKKLLIENLKKFYINDKLPMLKAFDGLVALNKDSTELIEWLKQAKSDNHKNELTQEIENILAKFNSSYFQKLEEVILTIKENPDFMAEVDRKKNIHHSNDAALLGIPLVLWFIYITNKSLIFH